MIFWIEEIIYKFSLLNLLLCYVSLCRSIVEFNENFKRKENFINEQLTNLSNNLYYWSKQKIILLSSTTNNINYHIILLIII